MAQYQHLPIAPLSDVRRVAHSYFGILDHADAYKHQGKLAHTLHRAGYGDAVPQKLTNARFPR